jgi:hypothetical protein
MECDTDVDRDLHIILGGAAFDLYKVKILVAAIVII